MQRLTTTGPMGGNLYNQVVNLLGKAIIEGRYQPGDILDLDELVENLGISRSVLREALRVMQALGLVQSRSRVGTHVRPREFWDLMNPQVIFWRGNSSDYFVQMRELLELRLGIEPLAASLSATAMPDASVAVLLQSARTMEEAERADNGQLFLDADVDFHTLILKSSGNSVFAHFSGTVEAVLRTRVEEQRSTITHYTSSSAHRHTALAEAIAARDPAAAHDWARKTLEATLEEFTLESSKHAFGNPDAPQVA